MKILSTLSLISCILFLSCTQQKSSKLNDAADKTSATIFNGVDTAIWKITFNKSGNLILVKKGQQPLFSERIETQDAINYIRNFIQGEVDENGALKNSFSYYVVHDMEKLIDYYNQYVAATDLRPDSLRIYFGKQDDNPYFTTVLVGMNGDNDIYGDSPYERPVNVGTLCPVNCSNSDFSNDATGDIFFKKAAHPEGATSRGNGFRKTKNN